MMGFLQFFSVRMGAFENLYLMKKLCNGISSVEGIKQKTLWQWAIYVLLCSYVTVTFQEETKYS